MYKFLEFGIWELNDKGTDLKLRRTKRYGQTPREGRPASALLQGLECFLCLKSEPKRFGRPGVDKKKDGRGVLLYQLTKYPSQTLCTGD